MGTNHLNILGKCERNTTMVQPLMYLLAIFPSHGKDALDQSIALIGFKTLWNENSLVLYMFPFEVVFSSLIRMRFIQHTRYFHQTVSFEMWELVTVWERINWFATSRRQFNILDIASYKRTYKVKMKSFSYS